AYRVASLFQTSRCRCERKAGGPKIGSRDAGVSVFQSIEQIEPIQYGIVVRAKIDQAGDFIHTDLNQPIYYFRARLRRSDQSAAFDIAIEGSEENVIHVLAIDAAQVYLGTPQFDSAAEKAEGRPGIIAKRFARETHDLFGAIPDEGVHQNRYTALQWVSPVA